MEMATNSANTFLTDDIKEDILSYIYAKRRILRRRSSTDCIFKCYLSENNKLLVHDPLSYITINLPLPIRKSKDTFAILAEKCRPSCILGNVEINLVDITDEEINDNVEIAEMTPINDDKLKFNDTLEEIDYILSCDKDKNVGTENIKSSKIPVKQRDTTPRQKVQVIESKKLPQHFKVPFNIGSKSSSLKKKNFKHIISPVATLINRSPISPFTVKHTPSGRNDKIHKPLYNLPKKCATTHLPNVTYKLSKQKKIFVKEDVHLPQNIEKHIGTSNDVIKHVTSTNANNHITDVSLKEEDLTFKANSLDDTNANISYVTHRKQY